MSGYYIISACMAQGENNIVQTSCYHNRADDPQHNNSNWMQTTIGAMDLKLKKKINKFRITFLL